MTDDAYATGLVIKDYWDVIHNTGMDEYAVCTAAPAWLDTLNRKQTLAAIAYLFRRNRFVEGSLINHSVASGALLRLFRHLRSFEESASEQPQAKNSSQKLLKAIKQSCELFCLHQAFLL